MFFLKYELLRELVSKEYLWKIEPWRSLPKKRSFDLRSYTPEQRELLTKAITCINYLVNLDSWEFIQSEGLMKEYTESDTPNKEIIYSSFAYNRPSLDFYSKRKVEVQEISKLKKIVEDDKINYLLVSPSILKELNLQKGTKLGAAEGFILWKTK